MIESFFTASGALRWLQSRFFDYCHSPAQRSLTLRHQKIRQFTFHVSPYIIPLWVWRCRWFSTHHRTWPSRPKGPLNYAAEKDGDALKLHVHSPVWTESMATGKWKAYNWLVISCGYARAPLAADWSYLRMSWLTMSCYRSHQNRHVDGHKNHFYSLLSSEKHDIFLLSTRN